MNKKVLIGTVIILFLVIGSLFIYENVFLNSYKKNLFNEQTNPIDLSNSQDVEGVRSTSDDQSELQNGEEFMEDDSEE